MTMSFNPVHGGCQCEANTFTITEQPIARFICHCLVCQEYSGKAYSDVSVFLRKDVKEINAKNTDFKRYKLPPNIRRGKCKNCHKPSIELGFMGQLVFIPTANIKDQNQLPEPSMHLFYHRRVADFQDNLPKYSGFVLSQTMVSLAMTKGVCLNVVGG